MSVELATAYVSIIPSAKGIESAIATQLKPVETAAATTGTASGTKMSGGILSAVAGTGTKLLKNLGFAAVGVAAFESAKTVEDAQNIIIRSTGAAGKTADSLLASFKRVGTQTPADLKTVATTLAEVYQRTGLTGSGLEKLTLQVVTFNRITKDSPIAVRDLTSAMAGFNVPGRQMGTVLDQLFNVSRKTGVPLSDLLGTLKTFGPVVRQFNIPIATAAGLLATLDKAGVNVTQIIPGLRRLFTNFAQFGTTPVDALRNVIGQIETLIKAGNTAGAQNLAAKIFGARGVGLVDAAVSGKLSLEQLAKALDITGKGIIQTGADTATFGAKLGILKNQATFAFAALGTPLLKVATAGMSALVSVAGALGGAFSKIAPALPPVVLGLGAMFAATKIGVPLLGALQKGALQASLGLGQMGVGGGKMTGALAGASNVLGGLASKLPMIAGTAVFAAASFDGIGKSATGTALGVGSLALAGATLGSAVLPGVGTAAGAAAGALIGIGQALQSTDQHVLASSKNFETMAATIDRLGASQGAKKFFSAAAAEAAISGGSIDTVITKFGHLASIDPVGAGKILPGLKALAIQNGVTAGEVAKLDAALDKGAGHYRSHAAGASAASSANAVFAGSSGNVRTALEAATKAGQAQLKTLQELQGATLQAVGGEIGFRQSIIAVHTAQDELNKTLADPASTPDQIQAAYLNLAQAQNAAASSATNLDSSNAALIAKFRDAPGAIDAEIAKFQALAAANPAIATSFDPIINRLLGVKKQLDGVGASHPTPTVDANTAPATSKANTVAGLLKILGAQHPAPGVTLLDFVTAKHNALMSLLRILNAQKPKPAADLTDNATTKAKAISKTLDGVHRQTTKPTVGVNDQASGTLNTIKAKLDSIVSKTVTIKVNYVSSGTPPAARGAIYKAGVRRMARGGFGDPKFREAMFANAGSNILWAEPGTGGESYIPWANDRRARSMAVLKMTAQAFGYNLVKMARGGITAPSSSSSGGIAEAPVQITVNPSAGQDESSIARRVLDEYAWAAKTHAITGARVASSR